MSPILNNSCVWVYTNNWCISDSFLQLVTAKCTRWTGSHPFVKLVSAHLGPSVHLSFRRVLKEVTKNEPVSFVMSVRPHVTNCELPNIFLLNLVCENLIEVRRFVPVFGSIVSAVMGSVCSNRNLVHFCARLECISQNIYRMKKVVDRNGTFCIQYASFRSLTVFEINKQKWFLCDPVFLPFDFPIRKNLELCVISP